MKFKRFLLDLFPGEYEKPSDNPAIEMIKKKCSQIVKIYKRANGVLFRGINRPGDMDEVEEGLFIKHPRTDREPKDSPESAHILFDDLFFKEFKWKPRSQGVFTAALSTGLTDYGKPFIIFPFDGFKYLWSPSITDLYTDYIEEGTFDYSATDQDGYWQNINDKSDRLKDGWLQIRKIKNYKSWKFVQNKDFTRSVARVTLTDGSVVTYVWTPLVTQKEWEDNLKKDMMSIVKGYKDTDLEDCIISYPKHEVTFKCDAYYLLEINKEVVNGRISPDKLGL